MKHCNTLGCHGNAMEVVFLDKLDHGMQITKTMLQNEAIKAYHKGLSAGLLRQATYTTTRLGSFKVLTNKVVAANDGKPLPLYQKALYGVIAGASGAIVGSPPDSSLIPMQAYATLLAARCQNYKNAFHGLYCCG
ncbi:Mitochondrial dicarboxylate/tricarboxylate transporter DTC [Vitis vinifera]|uniref:Mitochondrial dicarboxylate/tricarboxylate transporter DTC n=1 Tax=Vitis vinifera TaxID=29760 RepID=A0A438FXL4_VITVI|nr:Mitochondrial dicarboxylate/tricarboxylate transporter DTC [Vitis vinifera]